MQHSKPRPDDAVAIVTGGSGGIGAATCRALAAAGWTVLVGYGGNADAAKEVAASCSDEGATAEAIRVDVTDLDTVAAAVECAAGLGTLAALVNNGGVSRDGLLMRMTAEDLDAVLAVNLRGAALATKAVLRPMLRARWGRIVNVSSVVGLRGNVGQAAYAASKAGLIGLTKTTALEVARKGITANVVAPGLVETPMTADLPDAARESLLEGTPMARAVQPDEVAAAIAWLASPAASAVTGAVLPVDGGAAI